MPFFHGSTIGQGVALDTPSADGSAQQFLQTDGSGNLVFATVEETSPGGSDTQVQFNDSGSFGASADLTFDDSTDTLTVGSSAGTIYSPELTLEIGSSGGTTPINFDQNGFTYAKVMPGSGILQVYARKYGFSSAGWNPDGTFESWMESDSDGGLIFSSTPTTSPVVRIQTPASHADYALEFQDSTSATQGYFDFSSGNPKLMMLDFYDDEITVEGLARSLKFSHNGTTLATASSFQGSGSKYNTFYFDNIVFKNGLDGLADRTGYVAGGIINFADEIPTTVAYGNRHTAVEVQRDDTLQISTASMAAVNNERNDGVHLMLATGNASIAGTATEAKAGNIYAALGAGAGTGEAGKFIVRPLDGSIDLLTIDAEDGTTTVVGGDATQATPSLTIQPSGALGRSIAFADSGGVARGGIRQSTTVTTIGSNWANNHAQVELSADDGYRVRLNTIQGSSYFDQSGTYGATFKHGSAITGRINSDGMYVTGQNTANPVFQINMPASHANNAFEIRGSTTAVVASIDQTGVFVAPKMTGASANDGGILIGDTEARFTSDADYKWSIWSTYGKGLSLEGSGGIHCNHGFKMVGTNQFQLGSSDNGGFLHAATKDGAFSTLANASGQGTDLLIQTRNGLGGYAAGTTIMKPGSIRFKPGAGGNATSGVGDGPDAGYVEFLLGTGGTGFGGGAAGGNGKFYIHNGTANVFECNYDDEIGFFGATPVSQPSGTGETTGFTAGSGTGVNDESTFTGNVGSTAYRINDIVKALKNLGLIAS